MKELSENIGRYYDPLINLLIQPRDIAVFHGYINPDTINFIEKWAVKSLVKKPFGDFRNLVAIPAWAGTIANALKDAEPA